MSVVQSQNNFTNTLQNAAGDLDFFKLLTANFSAGSFKLKSSKITNTLNIFYSKSFLKLMK